jgi:hypothetical protein
MRPSSENIFVYSRSFAYFAGRSGARLRGKVGRKRDLPDDLPSTIFQTLARVVEWQTRTFEGRMPKGMRVQVPPRALTLWHRRPGHIFSLYRRQRCRCHSMQRYSCWSSVGCREFFQIRPPPHARFVLNAAESEREGQWAPCQKKTGPRTQQGHHDLRPM